MGLLYKAAQLREQAERDEVVKRSQRKCPRIAHEAGDSAIRNRRQADVCEKVAGELVDLVARIEEICECLPPDDKLGAHVILARRDLENASMRLQREIGDAPLSKTD